MSALVVTVLAVLAVAGLLCAALIHHPTEKETTMAEPTPTGIHPAFEDLGDRGSCTTRGRHDHCWSKVIDRDGEQVNLSVVVPVSPSGLVMLSEGSVEEILTAAGFEKAQQ